MTYETRSSSDSVRIETTEGTPRISGYAIVFDEASRVINDRGRRFREIITAQSVADVLAPGSDVRALYEHSPSRVLGRTKSGTMSYAIDKRGVFVSITPPAHAADVVASVKRGDVTGFSFSFTVAPGGDKWDIRGDMPTRSITRIESLPEISLTAFPAYPQTDAALRSLDAYIAVEELGGNTDILRLRLRIAEVE